MKIKQIAFAIAAILAAPAAFAADLTSGVPAGNIFYLGGASAQTPGLAKAITKFCSGTLTTYLDNTDGKQAVVWACSAANNTTSGLTGAFVVAKVDAGGSFRGVNSTANSVTMNFPVLTSTLPLTTITNPAITAGTLAGLVSYGSTTNPQIAQLSVSDVSVNAWKARGNVIAPSGWTVNPIFAGQGFGIIVSTTLYAALQADQGLTTADQPSISKQQYANVVSGVNGVSLNLLPNSATAATLRISRRSDTSGTQAASDIYFLNNPCNKGTSLGGALTPKTADFTDAAGTVVKVVAESSTGNVKANVSNAAGFAMGVVSLENLESGLGGAKYVKINGVSPNAYNGVADPSQKLSIINGQYDFAFEAQVITNDALTPGASPAQKLADAIVKDQGDGNNLTTSPGLYADPANAGAVYVLNQTSNYTRGQNECKPALYSF